MSSSHPEIKKDMIHERDAPSENFGTRIEYSSIPGVLLITTLDTETGRQNEARYRINPENKEWTLLRDDDEIRKTFNETYKKTPTEKNTLKECAASNVDSLVTKLGIDRNFIAKPQEIIKSDNTNEIKPRR